MIQIGGILPNFHAFLLYLYRYDVVQVRFHSF